MKDDLLCDDFDLEIGDVLLVHRCTYARSYKNPEYRNGRHMSGIVHTLSGSALYDFGDTVLTLAAGQTLFLPASAAYTVGSAGSEPFCHITANFTLARTAASSASLLGALFCGSRRYVCDGSSKAMREGLERLLAVWESKKTGYRMLSRALLYELLHLYFTDAQHSSRSGYDYARLLPAKHFLDERYTENVPVASLAAMCYLSETHFRRLFRELFGASVLDYRRDKRLLLAKDLLLAGDMTIGEIACAVGFEDANYFSRVFRMTTGLSPRAFRDRYL